MKYISFNENKLTEEERKINNNKFIEQELINQKKYFDNMFEKIDKNIILDENQRKIIITDEDNVMVIAGAGSGKTTTICAKVNYLIEKLNVNEEEIVVISFTNKAVEELKERINNDFKHKVKITTFHKFGYEIIKNNMIKYPKIISNKEQIIKYYIEKNIINQKQELKKFMELFVLYFDITEEIKLFKNYDKYYKYKKNQKYPTLKSKIEYINQIKEKNINNIEITNHPNETIIANYLYMNNIEYIYRNKYEKNNHYIPDFTIKINDKKIYIEYFDIEKTKNYKYSKQINKIRKIHKKYNTELIEVYKDNIVDSLKNNLRKFKATNNKNYIQIFNKLILENKDETYKKFIDFCINFINLYKSKGYKNQDFKKFNKGIKRTKLFIEFIEKLYNYYQNINKKNNVIDFEDMIIEATRIIKSKESINMKYKYIIIDEYQDISECRFNLIKEIQNKIHNKTIVVGDDWQCIYSFASSNINLFTEFNKHVKKCEILKITNTYRNSQELIDIAGKFILQNKNQINKQLQSNKRLEKPITILKYKSNRFDKSLINTIDYLIQKYGKKKNILILGRYTFDIQKLENKNIKIIKNKIIYEKNPEVHIEYMTVHTSKGLGYDNVIMINLTDDVLGFPSKIKNDPIIDLLIEKKEEIKFAEERRLFYVGLTRTKNEVILMTPYSNQSMFIKEINKQKNIKRKNNNIIK